MSNTKVFSCRSSCLAFRVHTQRCDKHRLTASECSPKMAVHRSPNHFLVHFYIYFYLTKAFFELEFVPHLVRVIEDPNSRLAQNLTATENAISAVTKIIQYNSSQVLHTMSYKISNLLMSNDNRLMSMLFCPFG